MIDESTGGALEIHFSPDGRWLMLWDWKGGCWQQWEVASAKLHRVPRRYQTCGKDVVFDPESKRMAIQTHSKVVTVYDIETGTPLTVVQSWGMDTASAFSPDGKLLLTVPEKWSIDAVRIWDAWSGDLVLSLEGHSRGVNAACFSPCGKYVASASQDSTVRLWRTSDGSCVKTLTEHRHMVESVAFSPDGRTLVSGDWYGVVIIRQMCDLV